MFRVLIIICALNSIVIHDNINLYSNIYKYIILLYIKIYFYIKIETGIKNFLIHLVLFN